MHTRSAAMLVVAVVSMFCGLSVPTLADKPNIAVCKTLLDRNVSDCSDMMRIYLSATDPSDEVGERCREVVRRSTPRESDAAFCIAGLFAISDSAHEFRGMGPVIAATPSCAAFFNMVTRSAQGLAYAYIESPAATTDRCKAIIEFADSRGVEVGWSNCTLGTNGAKIYEECVAPPGSDTFREHWMAAFAGCEQRHEPTDLAYFAAKAAQESGRASSYASFTCKQVAKVAGDNTLTDEGRVAALETQLGTDAALAREARLAALEEQKRQALEDAESFPDTFGKLSAVSGYDRVARRIEVARPLDMGDRLGSIWVGGLVDHLLSYCPVALGPAEVVMLGRYVVTMIAVARGPNLGGDFETAAEDALESGTAMARGAAAAENLNCAEPTSTKLLENVVAILSR